MEPAVSRDCDAASLPVHDGHVTKLEYQSYFNLGFEVRTTPTLMRGESGSETG